MLICMLKNTQAPFIPEQSMGASLMTQMVKNLPAMQETWVWSLSWEDLLETGMATLSSILAWRIPRTEEPGGLQFMGLQRVGHDWVTFIYTHCRCSFSGFGQITDMYAPLQFHIEQFHCPQSPLLYLFMSPPPTSGSHWSFLSPLFYFSRIKYSWNNRTFPRWLLSLSNLTFFCLFMVW